MTAQAFEVLYRACEKRVHSGILRYVRNPAEADEVTASAFAVAFDKRESFRSEATFFTWVYRIALNQVHSGSRSKRIVSLDEMEITARDEFIQTDLTEAVIDSQASSRRINVALTKVPLIYRQVLVDRFVNGFSTRQVARRRRIPTGTVLSRLFKGKRLLRLAWEG